MPSQKRYFEKNVYVSTG